LLFPLPTWDAACSQPLQHHTAGGDDQLHQHSRVVVSSDSCTAVAGVGWYMLLQDRLSLWCLHQRIMTSTTSRVLYTSGSAFKTIAH
jgi:hypothetical protein